MHTTLIKCLQLCLLLLCLTRIGEAQSMPLPPSDQRMQVAYGITSGYRFAEMATTEQLGTSITAPTGSSFGLEYARREFIAKKSYLLYGGGVDLYRVRLCYSPSDAFIGGTGTGANRPSICGSNNTVLSLQAIAGGGYRLATVGKGQLSAELLVGINFPTRRRASSLGTFTINGREGRFRELLTTSGGSTFALVPRARLHYQRPINQRINLVAGLQGSFSGQIVTTSDYRLSSGNNTIDGRAQKRYDALRLLLGMGF